MELSIVSTLYRSERYIHEFYSRTIAVAEQLGLTFELIFVDDGSPDDSLKAAIKIADMDSRVIVLELSKNHGHHRAMLAGLEFTKGDFTFLIDVDLEERPENLEKFWSLMKCEPDVDVIFGVQALKTKSGIRSWMSRLFYISFNALSDVKVSDRQLVSRLMTSTYVKALLEYKERELFLPAIWIDAGFKQRSITLTKSFDGHSSYTLSRRLKMAVDAITSFSTRPLRLIFYLGTLISAFSAAFIVFLITKKIALGAPLLGWTSTLASIYLMGGLILFALGVIGIYLSRIFLEVKNRPYPIVRKIHGPGSHI